VARNNILYNLVNRYQISKSLFIAYFVCFGLLIYFVLNIFFGNKGLLAYRKLHHQFTKLDSEKQNLHNTIESKMQAVQNMNLQSLDLDLVDEQSRKVLGYINKDEVIIYQKK